MLAGVASQALHVGRRAAGPALDPFVAEVRAHFPPVSETLDHPIGEDFGALMDAFSRRALG